MDNYYVKFGHFSDKNHVKFGHFVNFSAKFFGQKCLTPSRLSSYACLGIPIILISRGPSGLLFFTTPRLFKCVLVQFLLLLSFLLCVYVLPSSVMKIDNHYKITTAPPQQLGSLGNDVSSLRRMASPGR